MSRVWNSVRFCNIFETQNYDLGFVRFSGAGTGEQVEDDHSECKFEQGFAIMD